MLSPCKINLGLHIISKREDGYHNLETCFYPVPFGDNIEIEISDEFQLIEKGISTQCKVEDNLVFKAFDLLQKKYAIPNVRIDLTKNLPSGAGLGGGSANAAITLVQLNTKFKLGISQEKLELYAGSLGADCAFFIQNKAVFADGIGINFKREVETPDLTGYKIQIIHPGFGMSTVQAYKNCTPNIPERPLTEILQLEIVHWKKFLKNDFEESVFEEYPILNRIKEYFYSAGAIYSSMSGSGSAIFGIFPKHTDLESPPLFSEHQTHFQTSL